VLNRTYENQICSIARALEVVGERWTLLILRDAFLGVRRFDDFHTSLGIARNVLADRLHLLVDHGVLERVRYHQHPERFEYHLTPAGRELLTVLVALMRWGDRHRAEHGPPRVAEHAGCGGEVVEQLACTRCHQLVHPGGVQTRAGPGLRPVP